MVDRIIKMCRVKNFNRPTFFLFLWSSSKSRFFLNTLNVDTSICCISINFVNNNLNNSVFYISFTVQGKYIDTGQLLLLGHIKWLVITGVKDTTIEIDYIILNANLSNLDIQPYARHELTLQYDTSYRQRFDYYDLIEIS